MCARRKGQGYKMMPMALMSATRAIELLLSEEQIGKGVCFHTH
jgi:hypothetical protein